jgi:hypothetical protein
MAKKAIAQKRTKLTPGANAAEKAHTVVSSDPSQENLGRRPANSHSH